MRAVPGKTGKTAKTARPNRAGSDRWPRLLAATAVIAAIASVGGPSHGAASAAPALHGAGNAIEGANPDVASRHARGAGDLTVVDQTFTVGVDGVISVTLELPLDIDAGDFDDRSLLVVTSHRTIADPLGFKQSIDGDLTSTEDTFDVSLDPAEPDPNVVALEGSTLTVRVPTESVTRTPDALQISQSGVHPIVIELRLDDRPAGDVVTYVHRLPSITTASGPLSVSIVMQQTSVPPIGTDGTVSVDDAVHDELRTLADTLTAIDAAAADVASAGTGNSTPAIVPRGVQIEPSVLQRVVDTDASLAGALIPTLANSDLIASPRLPFDPSTAAAADQETRYGDWLRQGEDILGSVMPGTEIDRSVVLIDTRLSNDGAAMQRNLGARMMVMPYDFYTSLDGSLLGFTDISQLVTVELADGQQVPAAIVDEFLAAQMQRGADHPFSTAVEIAAELVVIARDIDVDGGLVDRHGVVLALPDLGIPDPALMSALIPLLTTTPDLRVVEPRDLATTTDTLLDDGRLVTITLPETAGSDLSSRLDQLDDVSANVLAYASMLPADSPDIVRWSATLDAFPSTAMTDDQADAAVERLDADFARYRDAVVAPDPFAFTLTGRESKFRFSLTNTSDEVLQVRVRLSSPKIRFPDGDQIIELPPQSETNVITDVEALSNGKSSVFLRIYAPAENRDVELAPEVVLTARVNSLAGLGQLITGAGLLLIITWWAHHTRSNRRKTIAARHQSRHPASRREPLPDAPAGEVSPDAAASSLPPS
jgi:hypothetical protein